MVSVMKNGRAMARCERQKLRHHPWDFCARKCAGSTASRPQREAFEEALGRQTKVSAEANLASGKHVENSVPYGTHLDVICWVLEDTGLDGEFARLGPLSARHS